MAKRPRFGFTFVRSYREFLYQKEKFSYIFHEFLLDFKRRNYYKLIIVCSYQIHCIVYFIFRNLNENKNLIKRLWGGYERIDARASIIHTWPIHNHDSTLRIGRNYRESKKNFHEFLLDFKKRKINYSIFLLHTLRRILFQKSHRE